MRPSHTCSTGCTHAAYMHTCTYIKSLGPCMYDAIWFYNQTTKANKNLSPVKCNYFFLMNEERERMKGMNEVDECIYIHKK